MKNGLTKNSRVNRIKSHIRLNICDKNSRRAGREIYKEYHTSARVTAIKM